MSIENAVKEIKKKYGDGSIFKMNDDASKIERFSSGSFKLDRALGGGYPRGRFIEIAGWESSAKSSLALHAVAEMQKLGGSVAYIDAEQALEPDYCEAIGVDMDDLFIAQPETMEEGLEITDMLVRSGVDLVVFDSTNSLAPRAEIEGEMGDSHMGLQARLLSQACRKINPALKRNSSTVIVISQIRLKIGVMYGDPRVMGVGNAMKFYASIRMETSKQKSDIEDGVAVSNPIKVKVFKNKTAPPFRTAELTIIYGEGLDKVGEMIDIAIEENIIEKRGSWFSYTNKSDGVIHKHQGKSKMVEMLIENELLSVIESELQLKLHN